MPNLLGSSVDPNKLALTVKGILVALVPLIILIANSQGLSLDEGTVNQTIEAIVLGISNIFAAVGTVMTIVGLVRKAYIKFFKKPEQQ